MGITSQLQSFQLDPEPGYLYVLCFTFSLQCFLPDSLVSGCYMLIGGLAKVICPRSE